MKTSIEIKTEMDKTQSRTTELENELNGQTASFEATQKAFIEGRSDVSASLRTKQNDASRAGNRSVKDNLPKAEICF
jgi:hypothetical protein